MFDLAHIGQIWGVLGHARGGGRAWLGKWVQTLRETDRLRAWAISFTMCPNYGNFRRGRAAILARQGQDYG